MNVLFNKFIEDALHISLQYWLLALVFYDILHMDRRQRSLLPSLDRGAARDLLKFPTISLPARDRREEVVVADIWLSNVTSQRVSPNVGVVLKLYAR